MHLRESVRGFELTRPPADFIDDPYPYYAALRDHDPVHALEGGGVLLTRYEDALAVYRDPRASSDKKIEFRPKFGDSPLYEHHTTSLVFSDPPLHTRVRRLIMGALNQRAIARMEADVARLVDALLERMAEQREFNFIDRFAAGIPVEVIGNLLNVPHGERLTEKELFHNCIFLLNAGHETTTNLIGNGMWLLLTHPGEMARLRGAPQLVPSAVEEMLRYEGPIQLNNRRLTRSVELGGKTVPQGTFITIAIGAVNRDPAQFADPERFDVRRDPNRHVAFGQGAHACAGMNVARMEGRVAFTRLLARFPKIELAGEPERDRRIRFRGFRKLPVRVG